MVIEKKYNIKFSVLKQIIINLYYVKKVKQNIKKNINYKFYIILNMLLVGGPWYKLADVIPEKLQISRKIRKYFTGDLNHEVIYN